MKKPRFTDKQIIEALKRVQAEMGYGICAGR